MLCSNRSEGFGPESQLYSHILTSCFLDTILVPLCTWLYLLTLAILVALARRRQYGSDHRQQPSPHRKGFGSWKGKSAEDVEEVDDQALSRRHSYSKTHLTFSVLYYLLLLAQILMCILEVVRLSLTHLGVGLLPFTFVTLIVAGILRLTQGLNGRMRGWRWSNIAVWIALAVTNGVKVAEEVKEGKHARRGSKYPGADEITDVSVMVGVYVALGILEAFLSS